MEIFNNLPQFSRIGILGGSFDPPHKGHSSMAESALHKGIVDEIIIIPCANHPFSKSLSDFEQRYSLCKTFFHGLEHTHISPIESTLPTPNFTANTLAEIKNFRPDLKLFFLMGADLLPELSKWHDLDGIQSICTFIVFPREGYPTDHQLLPKNCMFQIDSFIPGYESSQIRDDIKKGEPELSQYNAKTQAQIMDLYGTQGCPKIIR